MEKVKGPVSIGIHRGAVAILGPGIAEALKSLNVHSELGETFLHVTLLTPQEHEQLCKPPLQDLTVSLDQVYLLKPRKYTGGVRFAPVIWNHGNSWRSSNGLAPKAFHVTLSENNDHSLDKSIGTHLRTTATLENCTAQAAEMGIAAMDHLCVSISELSYESAHVAAEMITKFPSMSRGYLRLATASSSDRPKLACLAYAQAVAADDSLLKGVAQRLKKLSSLASYGETLSAAERDSIPPHLLSHLLKPWPKMLHAALHDHLWTAVAESRSRFWLDDYEMPRFFSWLYPGRVAGMSTPRWDQDIDILVQLGFTHVLSLTAESPLDPDWFRFKPIKHVPLPIEDYNHPTLAEMDTVLCSIEEGGTWLIHCGAGKGRAGTVLACLIAIFGSDEEEGRGAEPRMDARTAINTLRRMRPGSIENARQEAFVTAFVSHRWKSLNSSVAAEPVTDLQVRLAEGVTKHYLSDTAGVSLLFMIGKPGSGKSWLSQAISKRRGNVIVVSQDDTSKSTCEKEIGLHRRDGTLVIVDRCNPSAEDRRKWSDLATFECKRRVAVFFDYDAALCLQRIDRRCGHPVIRAGRGGNALEQFRKRMETPELSEGYDAVLTITSFRAANQALEVLTSSPPLVKFPRTPHLYHTGAATSDDLLAENVGNVIVGNLVVEEKIDGANFAFSLDSFGGIRCQNRSHWVNHQDHPQFRPLSAWLDNHGAALHQILHRDENFPERYILYGEWAVATHSVHYTMLPSQFLAFDLYDRLNDCFASRSRLDLLLRGTGIAQVPLIGAFTMLTKAEILGWCQEKSLFGKEKREGVYIRFEDDAKMLTTARTKVVRADFLAGNEHWGKAALKYNGVGPPSVP